MHLAQREPYKNFPDSPGFLRASGLSGRMETKTYGSAADTRTFQTLIRRKPLDAGARLAARPLRNNVPEKSGSTRKRMTRKHVTTRCTAPQLLRRGTFVGKSLTWRMTELSSLLP